MPADLQASFIHLNRNIAVYRGHGGNAAYWLAFHGLFTFPVILPTTTCLLNCLYTRPSGLGFVGVIRLSPEIPASHCGISFTAMCDSVPLTCGSVAFGKLEYRECGRSTDGAGTSIYPATEKSSLFHAASVAALLL